MFKKYLKQWSTYRGAVLAIGAVTGLSEVTLAYEAVNHVLVAATAVIGTWEVARNETKGA